MNHGNQHCSNKRILMTRLHRAREELNRGYLFWAREFLNAWRKGYAETPASTRRRWKCGK